MSHKLVEMCTLHPRNGAHTNRLLQHKLILKIKQILVVTVHTIQFVFNNSLHWTCLYYQTDTVPLIDTTIDVSLHK